MNEQEIIFDEVNVDGWEQNVMLSRLGIDPSRIGSTPYNPEIVQLFGALMRPATSREVRHGVWEHTFVPYNVAEECAGSVGEHGESACDYYATAIEQCIKIDEPDKEPQWNLSYQGCVPVHVRTIDPRTIRLKKIKRRQHRAAYRRKKRGLA
jgi:hypothetical protein